MMLRACPAKSCPAAEARGAATSATTMVANASCVVLRRASVRGRTYQNGWGRSAGFAGRTGDAERTWRIGDAGSRFPRVTRRLAPLLALAAMAGPAAASARDLPRRFQWGVATAGFQV